MRKLEYIHVHRFPFSAIVGQDRLCLALVLNAIDPRIGGVLVRGQKGTAKSTAARGLAEVLPAIDVVEGCPYNCHPTDIHEMCLACSERAGAGALSPSSRRPVPFVTLPLGATEDRVVGSIDFGAALQSGRAVLKPGLLAEANRGILYVDEINLLDDHLVDLLLDAAAMGRNVVERDGLSVVHPSRFVLVGTMNPEEGELRPQLLDRFGIAVDVEGLKDLETRTEILARLTEFHRAPSDFSARFARPQAELKEQIEAANARLGRVTVERGILASAAQRAVAADVDGHRADLTMVKVAVALSAWQGAESVREEHIEEAAGLVLAHRVRRRPFERPRPPEPAPFRSPPLPAGRDGGPGDARHPSPEGEDERPASSPSAVALPAPSTAGERRGIGARGGGDLRGKRLGIRPLARDSEPVDVAATLLSAAVRQGPERRRPVPEVSRSDLRTARVSSLARRAICFVVDASGSMAAQGRLGVVREAARRLLKESYQGRHFVSLVLASGEVARVSVELTRDAAMVERAVAEVRAGGKTPLAQAILLAAAELRRARGKGLAPTMVLLTDGRANVPLEPRGDPRADALHAAARLAEEGMDSLVVDTENDFVEFGMGRELAERLGAEYAKCETPEAETIVDWVRGRS